MSKKELSIKKGDTFLIVGTYTDSNNQPIDITNITIESHIKNLRKQLIAELEVTKEDQTNPQLLGKYVLKAQTTGWPVGELFWDIQYTNGDFIQSTETLTIVVTDEITS